MELLPAETSSFASPIPTQFVSSDEFTPLPQTEKQKAVEARCGGALARRSASGTGAALSLYHPAGHRRRTAQT
jgi:hypothetical protein